jgi:flagellar basal body-associated protein FliL
MAEKKTESSAKKKAPAPNTGKQEIKRIILAAIIIIIIAAAALFLLPMINAPVPFSTFKSNFQSALKIGVVGTLTQSSNQSQYVESCAVKSVENIAYTRKPSTIDFYLIAQNGTCTYQQGLGTAAPNIANASYCISLADNEPSVFLNYSSANHTSISASRLFAYGNAAYMSACPISVELG